MTRINPISVMQSRIAKRKKQITHEWKCSKLGKSDGGSAFWKIAALDSGRQQKEDRAILRRLIELERSNVILAQMFQQVVNYADALKLEFDMLDKGYEK